MESTVGPHEALIYAMVTMSAVDRKMSDIELRKIGDVVRTTPAFRGFDDETLIEVAERCGEILQADDGLDTVLDTIRDALPRRLHETAYAFAVEIAAADLSVPPEELRLLQLLRDRLGLDKLVTAAIERSAIARFRTVPYS